MFILVADVCCIVTDISLQWVIILEEPKKVHLVLNNVP